MKTTALALLTSIGLAFASSAALAGDKPPEGSKPLSEIVLKLEQAGYGPFEEIEFDDGRWEIDVYRNGEKRELHVDPKTGEVTKDKKDH